jgi:hypothetical protein
MQSNSAVWGPVNAGLIMPWFDTLPFLSLSSCLQRLRLHPEETLGEVKNRLQKEALFGGFRPPAPLKGKVALSQLITA